MWFIREKYSDCNSSQKGVTSYSYTSFHLHWASREGGGFKICRSAIILRVERHIVKEARKSGALALSIYDCFLTRWPNSAVPSSEQRWLTAVRVGGHCRSFRAFCFHSDPGAKAIYCILLISGVCTLLNYNYNSRWELWLATVNPPLFFCKRLAAFLLPFFLNFS